jgi:hypothetical protein
VMIEMERVPRDRLPAQTLGATKYRSRWMRRKPLSTMASQTSLTWEDPEVLAVKMEAMNLEAIAKEREKKLRADILTGTIWQERLKKQLEECSKNRRQASATVTSAAAGSSCQGHTASRRTEDKDDANTDDCQAELLHDVDKETFGKLDTMAADLDEMATRERWLFCRSCKAWHTVPCSKTSSKYLMLSILGLLLQTRPINAADMTADMQGKADYSIAESHGVAVYEHRYDAVLDASTSIIVIEIPFLRLRGDGQAQDGDGEGKQRMRPGEGAVGGTPGGTETVRGDAEQHGQPVHGQRRAEGEDAGRMAGWAIGPVQHGRGQADRNQGGQHEGRAKDGIGTPQCDGSPREGGGKIHWGGDRQTGGRTQGN